MRAAHLALEPFGVRLEPGVVISLVEHLRSEEHVGARLGLLKLGGGNLGTLTIEIGVAHTPLVERSSCAKLANLGLQDSHLLQQSGLACRT
jgi:hypothetical protein